MSDDRNQRAAVRLIKQAATFEVQTRTGRNTWENVWTEDDVPLTFTSSFFAREALRDHLNDCKAAGIEVYAKDFRINLVTA
jgi:hypothetical protein